MKALKLLASHLVVLGGAWFLSNSMKEDRGVGEESSLSTRVPGGGTDGILLARLLEPEVVEPSKYELLKPQLTLAENHQEAVVALLKLLPKQYLRAGMVGRDFREWQRLPPPTGDRIAEFEVRVRHWLSDDREACLKFLREGNEEIYLRGDHPVFASAFTDYALDEGEVDWVLKIPGGNERLYQGCLAELGTAKFLEKYGGDFQVGKEELAKIYRTFPFEDRDLVLKTIIDGKGGGSHKGEALSSFLSNKDHVAQEVTAWIRGLQDSGGIPAEFKTVSDQVFTNWLMTNPETPLGEKMELLQSIGATQMTVSGIVAQSLETLLNEGRDFRYEFRHGRVDAREVFEEMTAKLSPDSVEAEDALKSNLFYQLVGEDSIGAMDLLATLPKFRQEEVLIRAIGEGFKLDDPVLAKAYYDSFPESVNEAEEMNKTRNWDSYVFSGLSRYGDDFVDWVVAMPEGEFKERSVQSIVKWSQRVDSPIKDRVEKELVRK